MWPNEAGCAVCSIDLEVSGRFLGLLFGLLSPAAHAASIRPARRRGARVRAAGRGLHRRWSGRQTLRTATDLDGLVPDAVTVTDGRHPLFGQRLAVLSLTCSRGPAFIAVALPDGRRRLLRRAATGLEQPLTSQATSLPRISARTLLPLARHIRSMQVFPSKETCHADPSLPRSSVSDKDVIAPAAPTALGGAAAAGAAATDSADRPTAAARLGRGGAPC